MGPVFIFLMFFTIWAPSAAAAPKIYYDKQLAADKERYVQKFKFLLEQGLWVFMTPNERRALQGVALWHTLRGAGPLSFTSLVFEGRPAVRAPLASIKFIEDLSVAYAWRYQNRYSLEPIDEYLVMLKHLPAEQFPGGRAPDPITALGLPFTPNKSWTF